MQLRVLRSPALADLAAAVSEFAPTAVYVYGGTPGRSSDVERQAVAPLGLLLNDQGEGRQEAAWSVHGWLPLRCSCCCELQPPAAKAGRLTKLLRLLVFRPFLAAGAIQDAAVDSFAAALAGLGLELLFLDFVVRPPCARLSEAAGQRRRCSRWRSNALLRLQDACNCACVAFGTRAENLDTGVCRARRQWPAHCSRQPVQPVAVSPLLTTSLPGLPAPSHRRSLLWTLHTASWAYCARRACLCPRCVWVWGRHSRMWQQLEDGKLKPQNPAALAANMGCWHAASQLQAYALAAHMTKAHGTEVGSAPPGNGTAEPSVQEAAVPQLLALAAAGTAADAAANGVQPAALTVQQPALPATASVPALEMEGVDLSKGLAAAFPGYSDLRLLAPNAELRLLQVRAVSTWLRCAWMRVLRGSSAACLACPASQSQAAQRFELLPSFCAPLEQAGISSMVNPHNLRHVGEPH